MNYPSEYVHFTVPSWGVNLPFIFVYVTLTSCQPSHSLTAVHQDIAHTNRGRGETKKMHVTRIASFSKTPFDVLFGFSKIRES